MNDSQIHNEVKKAIEKYEFLINDMIEQKVEAITRKIEVRLANKVALLRRDTIDKTENAVSAIVHGAMDKIRPFANLLVSCSQFVKSDLENTAKEILEKERNARKE